MSGRLQSPCGRFSPMLSYPILRLATTENYSGVFLARAFASTALPSVQTVCGRSWSAHGSTITHGGTASRKLRSSSSRPPPFTLLMARCLLCRIDSKLPYTRVFKEPTVFGVGFRWSRPIPHMFSCCWFIVPRNPQDYVQKQHKAHTQIVTQRLGSYSG
jgi:hypothetical protein